MSVVDTILNSKQLNKSLSQSVNKIAHEELSILIIKHPTCVAAVSLQGGHLLFWQPEHTATPVIWLSDKAVFKKGAAIRGGVPICWPWFGRLGEPMHGFARIVDWKLESITESSQGVDLILSLTNNVQTQLFFDKPFNLTLTIHIGNVCQVSLSCLGDFEATSALHTYFGIDNISHTTVTGLGAVYQDRLTADNKPTVSGQLTFNQEVDRIYTDFDKEIIISDNTRKIRLTNYNASDVVTWNPWQQLSKNMLDLNDDAYQSIVCVETARINKILKLSPITTTAYGFKVELL